MSVGADATWVSASQIVGELGPVMGTTTQQQLGAPSTSLRVVTYNIKDGGVDPLVIAAAFQADPNLALADVILVQEAEAMPEEGTPRIERLAGALGMNWIYAPARTEKTGTLGDAILSRYPIDNFAVMNLPLATLKRQRIALAADVHVGTQVIRVVATQLDTSLNIANRIRQLHPIVIDLPDTALVGGDFNTNPFAWQDGVVPLVGTSAVVDTDQAPMVDDYMSQQGFVNQTAPLGITEIRLGVQSRLDAVYGRGLPILDGGVERDVTLSDHFPVWITLGI